MKNLKMNQEPLLPLNLFYQCYLLNQGPAASSQGPAASSNSDDENIEYSDEYSARSQDSGRTVLSPDLYILTNDEHWTVTPATHKFAAAARILFSDYGDRRTTGLKQFDYDAKCAAMTVPQESDRQFPNQRHATLYGSAEVQTEELRNRSMGTYH